MAVPHNARNERISLEEYFSLLEKDPEHRYEYLDGYIYMMTGGTPDHSIISNNVGRILGNLLQGRRCIVYNSDLYVELSDNYRVCPDVTVSCDPRDRGAKEAIHYPSLVVEVLSPTTEALIVELFRREKNGFWTLYTLGPNDQIELTSLIIRFPVKEIYQNTSILDEENEYENPPD